MGSGFSLSNVVTGRLRRASCFGATIVSTMSLSVSPLDLDDDGVQMRCDTPCSCVLEFVTSPGVPGIAS